MRCWISDTLTTKLLVILTGPPVIAFGSIRFAYQQWKQQYLLARCGYLCKQVADHLQAPVVLVINPTNGIAVIAGADCATGYSHDPVGDLEAYRRSLYLEKCAAPAHASFNG